MTDDDIRARNDALRRSGNFGPDTPNRLLVTPGVQELGDDAIAALYADLMVFDTFDPEDDPRGHHDFGTLSVSGRDVLFKIEDDPETAGAVVITLLLPEEY